MAEGRWLTCLILPRRAVQMILTRHHLTGLVEAGHVQPLQPYHFTRGHPPVDPGLTGHLGQPKPSGDIYPHRLPGRAR